MEQETKNILQRITSPWFFTFIPWWVVFNYDFLLRVLGKFETAQKINKYYCGAENIKYSILGCVKLNQEGRWDWWYTSLEWAMIKVPLASKFLIPAGLTILSLTLFIFVIKCVEEVYDSIVKEKDWLLAKRVKGIKEQCEKDKELYLSSFEERKETLNKEKEEMNRQKQRMKEVLEAIGVDQNFLTSINDIHIKPFGNIKMNVKDDLIEMLQGKDDVWEKYWNANENNDSSYEEKKQEYNNNIITWVNKWVDGTKPDSNSTATERNAYGAIFNDTDPYLWVLFQQSCYLNTLTKAIKEKLKTESSTKQND